MNQIILAIVSFFSFILNPVFGSEVQVRFEVNRIHGLYVFVETISDFPHRSQTLKKVFDQSAYAKDPGTLEGIRKFKSLEPSLSQGYSYPGLSTRENGISVEGLLVTRSASATDIDDFSNRIKGLLPTLEHAVLVEVLKKIEPIYNELIWEKTSEKLSAYVESIRKVGKTSDLQAMFSKALKFYGGVWPEGLPFQVTFYPIPGAEGHSSAESLGSFESVGVLVDDPNKEQTFGILFHELCHSVYESQSLDFQKELRAWFLKENHRFGRLAYGYLNEALATALGNGWAVKRATGVLDSGSWYAHKKINGFAKAIYDRVEVYVDAGRRIDQEFVSDAIESFASRFPRAIYSYDANFERVVLFTGGTVDRSFLKHSLRRFFRVASISDHSPIDDPQSLEALSSRDQTVVVLVLESEKKQLTAFSEAVKSFRPFLSRFLSNKINQGVSFLDSRSIPVVVLKGASLSDLERGVQFLSKQKEINPEKPEFEF